MIQYGTNGKDFSDYKEVDGSPKLFRGNEDGDYVSRWGNDWKERKDCQNRILVGQEQLCILKYFYFLKFSIGTILSNQLLLNGFE